MKYKDSHGKADGTSAYLDALNVKHKKLLDKLGIDSYNVSEISEYAKTSYIIGNYNETYTEYRVKERLKGG